MNVATECFDPPDGLYLKLDPQTDAISPYETTRSHQYEDPAFHFKVLVPAGFRTDLASIPRVIRWLFGEAGIHQRGCLFHDAAYRQQFCNQRQADNLMLGIHELDGVAVWKRLAIFYAVRLFGSEAWNENSKHLNVARKMMGVIDPSQEQTNV